ncbi:Neuritin [Ilyodon furcidens]|uniref:Neuritin n=1 Tax=Ilyodon furcidens TaxID=33524 RepID=A0ABV0TUZ9_9TELE
MGLTWSSKCLTLLLALHIVPVLQTVLVSAGQCDSVFKGFSDCLIQLGDDMANYPQDLDDRENLHKICTTRQSAGWCRIYMNYEEVAKTDEEEMI